MRVYLEINREFAVLRIFFISIRLQNRKSTRTGRDVAAFRADSSLQRFLFPSSSQRYIFTSSPSRLFRRVRHPIVPRRHSSRRYNHSSRQLSIHSRRKITTFQLSSERENVRRHRREPETSLFERCFRSSRSRKWVFPLSSQ